MQTDRTLRIVILEIMENYKNVEIPKIVIKAEKKGMPYPFSNCPIISLIIKYLPPSKVPNPQSRPEKIAKTLKHPLLK